MNLMPALELARIRSDAVKAVCDKTCTIRRNQQVFDPGGGSPDNYIDIADNVPCALTNLPSPVQAVLAQEDVGIETKTLHTPYGTEIIEDDEVTIDSVVYKVLSPFGEKTLQVFTSVVVRRVSLSQ